MYSIHDLNTIIYSRHRLGRLTLLLLTYSALFIFERKGQTRVPCNEITGDMGFTVRSVQIRGRWVSQELREKVEQIVGVGQPFDPPNVTPAIELVRDEIVSTETTFTIRLLGSTSVLYVDANVCDVSDSLNPRQAEVTIRAYYLRIDLYNLGRNMLPVPRSAKPSFLREVPSTLLATSPVCAVRFFNSLVAVL